MYSKRRIAFLDKLGCILLDFPVMKRSRVCLSEKDLIIGINITCHETLVKKLFFSKEEVHTLSIDK